MPKPSQGACADGSDASPRRRPANLFMLTRRERDTARTGGRGRRGGRRRGGRPGRQWRGGGGALTPPEPEVVVVEEVAVVEDGRDDNGWVSGMLWDRPFDAVLRMIADFIGAF